MLRSIGSRLDVPCAAVSAAESSTPDGTDPGSLDPVLVLTRIGLPYGTRLATWDAAGTALIWDVPQDLADRVGRGMLPRTDSGEGVYVEALVVDQDQHVLRGAEGQNWPATLLDAPGGPTDNREFRERLRQIIVAAARRGESVIVAPGGLAAFDLPAARASVVLDEDGEWVSVVEAFPPVTSEGWATAEQDEHSSRLSAPAEEEGMMGAAMLLLMAAATFTHGPELVGLYFESAPDGPWTG